MTRALTVLLASAAIALPLTVAQPAAARDRAGPIVAGAIIGLATAAIVGSAFAHTNDGPSYYAPAYGPPAYAPGYYGYRNPVVIENDNGYVYHRSEYWGPRHDYYRRWERD